MLILAAHLLLVQVPGPPAPPPSSPPSTQAIWWGWQPLIADGAALGLLAGAGLLQQADPFDVNGGRSASSALFALGIGGYILGGPIIHTRHGDWLGAVQDVARRVGLPVLCGFLGLLYDVVGHSGGAFTLWGGAVVGPAIAIGLDAVLSWDQAPAPAPAPGPATVEWTPFIGAARGSPLAGVAARF